MERIRCNFISVPGCVDGDYYKRHHEQRRSQNRVRKTTNRKIATRTSYTSAMLTYYDACSLYQTCGSSR